MKKGLIGLLIGLTLGTVVPAGAHGNINKDAVRVEGYALCNEDERLVPIRHHGYNAESVSGWTYRCVNFENKREMVR